MKRLLLLLLVAMLCLLPALGSGETAPSIEDAAYRAQTAEGARALLELFAGLDVDFSGAPDTALVWRALSSYVQATAPNSEVLGDAELASLYGDIFAEGSFHDHKAHPEAQFKAVAGGYGFTPYLGLPRTVVSINDTDTYREGEFFADVSVWRQTLGAEGETFSHNVILRLIPDPEAAFGARVGGCETGPLPVFDGCEASAVLRDMDGNNYKPENARDLNPDTCWAAPFEGTPAITLTAATPQNVRGVALTPGYAKSEYAYRTNDRIARLLVTLGGGECFTFELAPFKTSSYEATVVLPFGALIETSSIKLEILDVHPGDKFSDICISEIAVF